MSYKVLTDGNGSGLIHVVGLGYYMPLKDHQAMIVECQEKSQAIFEIMAERDSLVSQLTDAFGDGYYDGFLDGAKHHEKTDCNTEPTYLGDHALLCSEIAESEKASRIGGSKKQHALDDIKSEAGRVGFIAGAEIWSDYGVKSRYKDDCLVDIEADAIKYAAKIRNGEIK